MLTARDKGLAGLDMRVHTADEPVGFLADPATRVQQVTHAAAQPVAEHLAAFIFQRGRWLESGVVSPAPVEPARLGDARQTQRPGESRHVRQVL
jgi:hypothetical protein